jgi:hypothetical protein
MMNESNEEEKRVCDKNENLEPPEQATTISL